MAWGTQAVFLKIAMQDIPVYGAILITLIVNSVLVVILVVVISPQGFSEYNYLSGSTYLYFMIAGILTYLMGRGLYYGSFRYIGVAQATSISSTYPLLSAVFAIIFLAEELAFKQYLGVGLTLIGVYLLIWKGKQ